LEQRRAVPLRRRFDEEEEEEEEEDEEEEEGERPDCRRQSRKSSGWAV